MSDAKSFSNITMGKGTPPKKKKKPVINGCRVFPLRIALLGLAILELPVIYRIQEGEDLELLLKKRKRLITELLKEKLLDD